MERINILIGTFFILVAVLASFSFPHYFRNFSFVVQNNHYYLTNVLFLIIGMLFIYKHYKDNEV